LKPRVLAVVPTIGESDLLGACLASLARQVPPCPTLVVWQPDAASTRTPPAPVDLPDAARLLVLPENRGFAGAANAALRSAEALAADHVALVNDDVVLEPGWVATLAAALATDPRLGAVQGTNLLLTAAAGAGTTRFDETTTGETTGEHIDGVGIAWNRWWQAVQLLRDRPAGAAPRHGREVFGVAGTAALYRREALAASALPSGDAFDERLFAYYEDVDLAGRLRAAGYAAATVPAASARHRGSATGLSMPRRRLTWIYGNRWLVAARLLGAGFPLAAPRLLARDAADLARALLRRGDAASAFGIGRGLLRAARLLPHFLRAGPPLLPRAELRRLGAERWARELPAAAPARRELERQAGA
jgi:GT2 family glycosyltransferase